MAAVAETDGLPLVATAPISPKTLRTQREKKEDGNTRALTHERTCHYRDVCVCTALPQPRTLPFEDSVAARFLFVATPHEEKLTRTDQRRGEGVSYMSSLSPRGIVSSIACWRSTSSRLEMNATAS